MYCQNTENHHLFSFFIFRHFISKGHIQLSINFLVKNNLFYLALISALFFSTASAMAQELTCEERNEKLCFSTSEKSYEEDETIVLSGIVNPIILDEPVTIRVVNAGSIIHIAQLQVAQDGTFSDTIRASGPNWRIDGTYTISAFYGTVTYEQNIEFFTKQDVTATTKIFEVDAGSAGTFDVDYTIRGASVKNMLVDPEIFALIVIIVSDDDGSITLQLPRESIDAKKTDDIDDTFIILIDGIEVPYEEEVTNQQARTITIEFEQGDSDIEIIGTFVIPEFGNVVMLILVLAIISTILISTKKRILIR